MSAHAVGRQRQLRDAPCRGGRNFEALRQQHLPIVGGPGPLAPVMAGQAQRVAVGAQQQRATAPVRLVAGMTSHERDGPVRFLIGSSHLGFVARRARRHTTATR